MAVPQLASYNAQKVDSPQSPFFRAHIIIAIIMQGGFFRAWIWT